MPNFGYFDLNYAAAMHSGSLTHFRYCASPGILLSENLIFDINYIQ